MQNNIESLFVPYQIALDMKSIGFDEPCFSYYLEDGTRIPASYSWEGTVYPSNADLLPEWCTAPTFSQAFRFFREKHDLDVISKPHIRKTKKYVCDPVNIRLEAKNTYEEAELECLKKLIQIIKEKL
jgi:hypothetical protein